MADDLFSIKNEFYLGNYMGAINEAQSGDLELSTPADERDRDVIIYRSYLALGQYDVVQDEVICEHGHHAWPRLLLLLLEVLPSHGGRARIQGHTSRLRGCAAGRRER